MEGSMTSKGLGLSDPGKSPFTSNVIWCICVISLFNSLSLPSIINAYWSLSYIKL